MNRRRKRCREKLSARDHRAAGSNDLPSTARQAAASALYQHTQLPAKTIAEEGMKIAARMCIYTNDQFTFEEL